jgi:hypothetical protein
MDRGVLEAAEHPRHGKQEQAERKRDQQDPTGHEQQRERQSE